MRSSRHAARLLPLLPLLLGVGVLLVLPLAQAAHAAGETINGRVFVRGAATPAGNASITVKKGDETVATVQTKADGTYTVPLPGPGRYTLEVDESTLPKDTKVGIPDTALTVNIVEDQVFFKPIPLTTGAGAGGGGSGGGGGGGRLEVLQNLVEGIRFGLIIAITAVGLSLIYGTTGLTNFAHGEIVTFGAMVAWWLNVSQGIQLVIAAAIAMVVTAVCAGLLNLGLWQPLRRRGVGLVAAMIVSIGLSLVLRYLYVLFFGGRTKPYGDYTSQRAHDFGPINLTDRDMWSIGLSLLVMVGVALLLQRTRIGKAMRAVADNRDLAASSGINVDRVVTVVWALGGALAAFGGVLYGLSDQVGFEQGFRLLLLMFAGITLGGLGTAYGALVGSLIVGILVQESPTFHVPTELKTVTALAVLILILLVRPTGILGARTRIG